MIRKPLVIGAVAYDPKVISIWDGFSAWFKTQGLPIDYILFTNYERQVEAHLAGQIDVAWNSPLAFLQLDRAAEERNRTAHALAMRDTDQDLTSVFLARKSGLVKRPEDLRGKRIGVGAADSPQATLIPLVHLAHSYDIDAANGLEVVHHDVALGKHGDHIGGERDAVRSLTSGAVDVACVLDANHLAFQQEGLIDESIFILDRTPEYDHCNFSVLDGASDAEQMFTELLLGMRYEDPRLKALFDLEGLRAWKPGRATGYVWLSRAIDRFATIDAWLSELETA